MKKIFVSFILLFSLFLSACGSTNQDVSKEQDEDSNGSGGIVAGEVEPSLIEKSQLQYEYRLKNQTEEEVVLEFSSSQRYDYSISTKDGKEVFLYSSTASFLQVEGTEALKQGEELIYDINLSQIELEKGEYVLSVWMTPKDGEKFKIVTDLTIETSSSQSTDVISAEGVYNGQVDPHTIEVTVNGETIALQTLEFLDVDFSKVEDGSAISIEYYQNELGQSVLKSFSVN